MTDAEKYARMRSQVRSLIPFLVTAREKLNHYRAATGARPVDGIDHEYVIGCIDGALREAAAEVDLCEQAT